MNRLTFLFTPALVLSLLLAEPAPARTPDGRQKLVLIAGKPSHPPRMHEFNAGVQLLAKCLARKAGLKVEYVLNGWPQDETVFNDADAVVFYMDGGKRHEVVQGDGSRLSKVEEWAGKGMGIGCLHYGVTVDPPDNGGAQFKRWIGGHYEELYSVNPLWKPKFENWPDHPITRGVKPFVIEDEWYFNIRFVEGFSADGKAEKEGTKFTPILVAKPSDETRDGPYVYPKGPYPHVQAARGRMEAVMWAVERPDGGRGVGFTGGHFHDNWTNNDFRKTVLNALVWLAKAEVPPNGVDSLLTKEELDANLDVKKK